MDGCLSLDVGCFRIEEPLIYCYGWRSRRLSQKAAPLFPEVTSLSLNCKVEAPLLRGRLFETAVPQTWVTGSLTVGRLNNCSFL